MKRPAMIPENARVARPILASVPVPIKEVRKGNVIATVGVVTPVRKATMKGRKKIIKKSNKK